MLGGELQTAAGDHRQMANLADHSGKPRGRTGAQPFLDGPQDLVVAPRPDQHEAAGIEAVRQQARSVQIRPPEAPQHRRFSPQRVKPGEDAGGKPGCRGGVLFVATGTEDLVYGAERQPALRQSAVDRRHAKRQRAVSVRLL